MSQGLFVCHKLFYYFLKKLSTLTRSFAPSTHVFSFFSILFFIISDHIFCLVVGPPIALDIAHVNTSFSMLLSILFFKNF